MIPHRFALPIGWLTDRGRGFAVLVAGLIVAALGTAAFAFAQSVTTKLCSRA